MNDNKPPAITAEGRRKFLADRGLDENSKSGRDAWFEHVAQMFYARVKYEILQFVDEHAAEWVAEARRPRLVEP